jgi:DNA helicase-2/ATP-dependent DNA helicase PcrA
MVALVDRLLEGSPSYRARLLTFTRAATGELAKKVSGHPAAAILRPSTVHSFAISVLMHNPGAGDFPVPLRMADDWEYHEVLRPSLGRYAEVGLKTLDLLVNEMQAAWQSLVPEQDPKIDPTLRARFLGAWSDHRRVFGNTLLGELPDLLRQALLDHSELANVDYDMLVVDEYQDLNACDLELLRLLADRGASLLGAGDDDQSVYSFRKADPEGIRRFPSDYPAAADYSLTVTQRCGRRIIDWAQFVIAGDAGRPQKKPLVPRDGAPEGEVALLAFNTDKKEAAGVADLVARLIESGVEPGEILILSRTDQYGGFSRPIKEELAKKDIEAFNPDYVGDLLAEDENRRFLERARLLVDPTDSIAWASLLRLEKGIGARFHDHVLHRALESRQIFGRTLLVEREKGFPDAPATSGRLAVKLIAEARGWIERTSLPEGEVAWGSWLASLKTDPHWTPSPDLSRLLVDLDALTEPGSELGRYLGQVAPLGADLALAQDRGVRFMTIMGSKGLTVRATIVVGVEDVIIPRPAADLAEERRLLYVAMTRSTEFLFCTWARRRYGQTARVGGGTVGGRRQPCAFLRHGPVSTEDGQQFLRRMGAKGGRAPA